VERDTPCTSILLVGGKGFTSHVNAAGGGKGYILHVLTVLLVVKGYILHVHTAGGWKGIQLARPYSRGKDAHMPSKESCPTKGDIPGRLKGKGRRKDCMPIAHCPAYTVVKKKEGCHDCLVGR
jgi:hypothetical protein